MLVRTLILSADLSESDQKYSDSAHKRGRWGQDKPPLSHLASQDCEAKGSCTKKSC